MDKASAISVNRRAVNIVENAIQRAQDLAITVISRPFGVTVLDMGVLTTGSWEAGKIFAEAAMGGMGSVSFGEFNLGGIIIPSVNVYVNNPSVACMSSHVAGWQILEGRFSPIAGGPVRAIRGLDRFARAVGYRDESDQGVATLQLPELPSDELLRTMKDVSGVQHLYVMVAKTASLVGMIQVCARTVEQVLPTLWEHGFDVEKTLYGFGRAPLPPLVDDELEALGRVNDSLVYGNETTLVVRCDDDEIAKSLSGCTFKNNTWYGQRFRDIFEAFGCDWYKVPRQCDAPAKINLVNAKTGRLFTEGEINVAMLKRSFFGGE